MTSVYIVNNCFVNQSSNLQYNCCCLESRAFPDISLSPQRGSFSSGCKYKSSRESVKDGSGDLPATSLSSGFKKKVQSSVFTMIMQHRRSSVNTVLHMDHSQAHSSVGGVTEAATPTEITMVGQHLRMMTAGHLVDHLTHDTIRATSS